MAARTVVCYDDITLPYDAPAAPSQAEKSSQPPTKKRKKNAQKGKQWDNGPSGSKGASGPPRGGPRYGGGSEAVERVVLVEEEWDAVGDGEYAGEEEEEGEEEEGRSLTHEEIWDDSALVDAWESAMEEYKAMNGGGGDTWKSEPVKKSPLWYNVPPKPSTKKAAAPKPAAVVVPLVPAALKEEGEEGDSQPLNFATFVPTHDASLEQPAGAGNPVGAQYIPDTPAGAMVSQDEAFSRALSAMYWGGYWTAMYHAQRLAPAPVPTTAEPELEPEEDAEEDDDVEIEDAEIEDLTDFTPTQR